MHVHAAGHARPDDDALQVQAILRSVRFPSGLGSVEAISIVHPGVRTVLKIQARTQQRLVMSPGLGLCVFAPLCAIHSLPTSNSSPYTCTSV